MPFPILYSCPFCGNGISESIKGTESTTIYIRCSVCETIVTKHEASLAGTHWLLRSTRERQTEHDESILLRPEVLEAIETTVGDALEDAILTRLAVESSAVINDGGVALHAFLQARQRIHAGASLDDLPYTTDLFWQCSCVGHSTHPQTDASCLICHDYQDATNTASDGSWRCSCVSRSIHPKTHDTCLTCHDYHEHVADAVMDEISLNSLY